MSSKHLSGSLSPWSTLTTHLLPHASPDKLSGLFLSSSIFYLPFSHYIYPLPPSLLAYYLMQAQTSHSCSSGLFLSSSIFHSHFSLLTSHLPITTLAARLLPHTSPDEPSGLFLSSSILHSPFSHHIYPSPPSPLAYHLMQAQTSHSCSSGLILSSFVLHSHFAGHKYPDELQALIWLLFSSANTHYKPRQAINACLGLYFTFFSSSPPLLLAYYLMQAQTSHTCLFGLILSSSVLHSHIVGHTYPDELHELVWVCFLSTTAMESCKLR
jgi:hypothetical protein